MQRAFIVKVDIDPTEDASLLAEQIREAVEDDGFAVLDVQPWASPNEVQSIASQILTGNDTTPGANLGVPSVGGLGVNPPLK